MRTPRSSADTFQTQSYSFEVVAVLQVECIFVTDHVIRIRYIINLGGTQYTMDHLAQYRTVWFIQCIYLHQPLQDTYLVPIIFLNLELWKRESISYKLLWGLMLKLLAVRPDL